jgi:hypothetical protein
MNKVPIFLEIHPKIGQEATSDLATKQTGIKLLMTWVSIQEIWFDTIKHG